MKRIEAILKVIEQTQKNHQEAWKEANSKYDDPTYSEEFEDTLQRKYDEGSAEALLAVLELFAEINLEEVQKEIATNGAQEALEWLEEVYGSGIRATGAWQTYFGDEEGEE